MSQSKRQRFRNESNNYTPEPRKQTMTGCPTCYGKGKERTGIAIERYIKCTQCGGKGRIPYKV